MGPPFLPGGEEIPVSHQLNISTGFNGAALFTGRRASCIAKKHLGPVASMGPPFLPGGESK